MLSGLKILLAEDNPTNQMVAVQMLESLGAAVTLAVDGVEALESLQETDFDAALIDIEMPRISGIDLIQRLRGPESPAPSTPLIAITAYVMREHRTAIEAAGADGIIAKPIVSIEQFGTDILGYIRSRAAKSAATEPESDCSASPGLDQAVFDRLVASFDGPARSELISKVTSDLTETRDRISTAITDGDMEAIRGATHVMISVAGVIGARKLQEFAKCLNSAGHVADSEKVNRVGQDLVAEADTILRLVGDGDAD